MPRVMVTDEHGAWTGAWFDSADPAAQHFNPGPNRGVPYVLYLTKTGKWVLVRMRGDDRSSGIPTAVLVPEARAAAILVGWGKTPPPALLSIFNAQEL